MYESGGVVFLVLLWLCIVFPSTHSSHFLGGSIMVRPKPGGAAQPLAEIEITVHLSWRRSFGSYYNCNSSIVADSTPVWNGSLSCQYGCQGSLILPFLCTEYSVESDWSYLEAHSAHLFCGIWTDAVTIGTVSGGWVSPYGSWNISTTFSLNTRADTGEINSSPRIASFPYLYLLEGYHYTIPLTISDPDNDIVRCRWANGTECLSVCNSIPGAVLDPDLCTISYYANNGTGLKAVAIMIEDFLPSSTMPLSSVAHQFLVYVVSSFLFSCSQPYFITPQRGICINIPPNTAFTNRLTTNSQCSHVSINSIKIIAPIGTTKGVVQRIPGTNNYYTDIIWTPTTSQQNNTYIFCFIAISSEGFTSEQSCIKLAVYHPPSPLHESATPNHQFVYPSNNTLQIMFDGKIQRPSTPAFIRFYKSGEVVYQIDTSSSLEVKFNGKNLTIVPNNIFTGGSTYHLNFDEGVVESVEGCHLSNIQILGGTFWTFDVINLTPDVTAVNNQTVGQPLILQCSVTTIRDINSRVDFVWISNGRELKRVEGVTGESSTNNLAVYRDYYIIPQLSIADNNSLYTCEVIINRSPLTSATDNFTLNVTEIKLVDIICNDDPVHDNDTVSNNDSVHDNDTVRDNNTVRNNDTLGNIDTVRNNDAVCDSDDHCIVFTILFGISAGVNLLLVVAIIILTCLVLKQKKSKPVLTNYRAENQVFKSDPVYELPTLERQAATKPESPHYVNLPRHQNEGKKPIIPKKRVKPNGGASDIKLEDNPSYRTTSNNYSNL